MLTLVELSRAVEALTARIAGHRIQGVVQPDPHRVVLATYGPAEAREDRKHYVLLSCRPETARITLLANAPPAPPEPPPFARYLKAHVVGGVVTGARLLGGDRLAALDLATREGEQRLVLSLLGRRSNVYLLDSEERVVATLRPLPATRPELALGEPWKMPASRPPGSGEDRFAGVSDERLLEAIEERYAAEETEGEYAALERRIAQALRKEARRLDRKLERLDRELEAADDATKLARHGELLKGALSKLRRGDREAVVRDLESGEDVTIALDPTLSPSQNLDRLFKRYRKALRSLSRGGAQRDEVRDARRGVEELETTFREAAEAHALESFAEDARVRALLARFAPGPPPVRRRPSEVRLGGQTVPRRLLPRRYRTAEDLEIWVGRSDEANDHLSTRLARGKDLFFHLEGAPGSHVVLRTEGRSDPPSEALLDACELAVHFSRFKNATRADVHVVPIKNVRKPRGAKTGLVTVHGGKTVHLRRDAGRLRRVLEARLEED